MAEDKDIAQRMDWLRREIERHEHLYRIESQPEISDQEFDRLVKELRRRGASTLAEANDVLHNYLPRFNKRFMKPAAQPGSAYRPRLTRAEANARICFIYWRTVANDHTIALFGHDVALPDLPVRLNLAGRRIQLHHRMDGRLAVVYKGQVLGKLQPAQLGPPRLEEFTPAPQHLARRASPAVTSDQPPAPKPVAESARAKKPAYDHPWRRQGRASYRRRQQMEKQKQQAQE